MLIEFELPGSKTRFNPDMDPDPKPDLTQIWIRIQQSEVALRHGFLIRIFYSAFKLV